MPPSPFMARALDLASAVRGYTSPNPSVGAVIVQDGDIVAEDATSAYPGSHAEANALRGRQFPGATMYVTLEPCAPFPGKRTPPCAEAIVAAGVARVVIAMQDPDPNVGSRGIATLREAGISVELGDGESEARHLLRAYAYQREHGRPYVIAKFAATLDGRIATASGDSKWITGPEARNRGHEQRAWVDAILAGSGTILMDDPSLTARPEGIADPHQPVRVILDARGRTPPTANVFQPPGITLVATTRDADPAWRAAIVTAGGTIIDCEPGDTGVNLTQLLRVLGQRGILSIWAEGGAGVLGSLFDEGLVNETWAFIAPKILGGAARTAIAGQGAPYVSAAHQLHSIEVERLGDDILIRGYVG